MLTAGKLPRWTARMLETWPCGPSRRSIWRCNSSNSANKSPGTLSREGYIVCSFRRVHRRPKDLSGDGQIGFARVVSRPVDGELLSPSRRDGSVGFAFHGVTGMRSLLTCVLLASSAVVFAQERAIDKEVTVAAPVSAVWQSWTSKAGIESFFGPEAEV